MRGEQARRERAGRMGGRGQCGKYTVYLGYERLNCCGWSPGPGCANESVEKIEVTGIDGTKK